MMNSNPLPPNNPHELGNMLVSLVQLLADPEAAQSRIRDYVAAHKTATDQIQQAARDLAAVAAARAEAETEISRRRQQFDFERRNEADEHRAKMASERAALEVDRDAARKARSQAEADAAEAQRIRADLARRLKLITEPAP